MPLPKGKNDTAQPNISPHDVQLETEEWDDFTDPLHELTAKIKAISPRPENVWDAITREIICEDT